MLFDRLELLDRNDDIAVVYRCWWQLRIPEHHNDAFPYVRGCKLLERPDVVARLRTMSMHPLMMSMLVGVDDLVAPDAERGAEVS